MGRPDLKWLQVFGFPMSVFVAGFFGHQKANAQAADTGLSITIVCIDIDSLMYRQLQQTLDLSTKSRNCQRDGLKRHKLTGVYETDETH